MTTPDDIIGSDQATYDQLIRVLANPKEKPETNLVNAMALVKHNPALFCKIAYPWGKGEFAASQGLRDWQMDIANVIGKHLQDPKTRHTPLQIAVASGHGIGKSSMVSMLIDWALSTCVGAKIVVTANTENQLRTKTWPEVTKWVRSSINAHWFEGTATAVMATEKGQELNWRADAIPWSENNTEAFAGLHNAGKRLVLIFDESSAISDKVWEVAEGAMTDADTEIIWLAFGNPTQNTGRFRECFGKFKHRWVTRQIDSRTVDGTNKKQIQTWIDDYGEDSDFVRVRVRGEFPRSGNLQFISSEVVELARKRPPEAKLWDARVMGVDVARFGSDISCICFRQGRDAQSNKWIKLRNVDTMTLAAHIVDAAKWFHPDAIFVDGGGVGGGVVDRLRQLRQPVFEVQFGGAPDRSVESGEGAVHYVNKRAEMWGNMKDWLKGGSIPDDPDLVQELTSVQYGYLFKEGIDKIMLEKKVDMKKRGLSSPDAGDALCFVGSTLIKTPRGDRRIDSLRIGDEVLTPFGVAEIKIFWESNTEELTTATFSNRSVLQGKGAHKIFTWNNCGQTRLDALPLTIEIETYSFWSRLKWRIVSRLSTKARNTGFKMLVDILGRDTPLTASGFYTGVFGLTIMGRSLKAFMCTIRTMIGGIAALPILLLKNPVRTWRTIDANGLVITNPQMMKISQKRVLQPLCGMGPQKESNGISSMEKKYGKDENLWERYARYVMLPTGRSSHLDQGFVATLVCRLRAINAPKLVSGLVISAERVLQRINTARRRAVPESVVTENVLPTRVYNLTLDKDNAYYANGVLVYNCLTFAYPVMPSDHRDAFETAVKGGHKGANYNPFDIDRVRGM